MHAHRSVTAVFTLILLFATFVQAEEDSPELKCMNYFSFAPFGANAHPALRKVFCPRTEQSPVYVRVYLSDLPLHRSQCLSQIVDDQKETASYVLTNNCPNSDPKLRWTMELHCCSLIEADSRS